MALPFDLGALFTRTRTRGVQQWQDTFNLKIRTIALDIMTKINEIIAEISSISGSNKGEATIVFSDFSTESSINVTGQTGINSTSGITAVILSDSDDVLIQDWSALLISNIVEDVGFTITAKPSVGRWKGNLIIKWNWS